MIETFTTKAIHGTDVKSIQLVPFCQRHGISKKSRQKLQKILDNLHPESRVILIENERLGGKIGIIVGDVEANCWRAFGHSDLQERQYEGALMLNCLSPQRFPLIMGFQS